MHCWGWFGNAGWTGMLVITIVTLAILVGLIVLVIWAVRRLSYGSTVGSQTMTGGQAGAGARDILQMRYARGEITREQYQQMLSDIER